MKYGDVETAVGMQNRVKHNLIYIRKHLSYTKLDFLFIFVFQKKEEEK